MLFCFKKNPAFFITKELQIFLKQQNFWKTLLKCPYPFSLTCKATGRIDFLLCCLRPTHCKTTVSVDHILDPHAGYQLFLKEWSMCFPEFSFWLVVLIFFKKSFIRIVKNAVNDLTTLEPAKVWSDFGGVFFLTLVFVRVLGHLGTPARGEAMDYCWVLKSATCPLKNLPLQTYSSQAPKHWLSTDFTRSFGLALY